MQEEVSKVCSSSYINKNKHRGGWTSLLEQCLTKSKLNGKLRISEKVIRFICFIFFSFRSVRFIGFNACTLMT